MRPNTFFSARQFRSRFFFLACSYSIFTFFLAYSLKAIVTTEAVIENNWPLCVKKHVTTAPQTQTVSALGPLIQETQNSNGEMATMRPFFVKFVDKKENTYRVSILYPFLSYERTPYGSNWNFFNLLTKSASAGKESSPNKPNHFILFPLFINRTIGERNLRSRGLFPVVGDLHSFWGNDRFAWFFFPFWLETQRGGENNYSFPWPFFRRTVGPNTQGGAFWPLAGHYEKRGVYKKEYFLWPLVYNNKEDLDKPIPSRKKGWLPFYCMESSAKVKSQTFIWPFFGYMRKDNPYYYERHYLWPLWVKGKGEKIYVNRWAPFYTHSINKEGVDKQWLFWPCFKRTDRAEKDLNIRQVQMFYFLVWTQKQKSVINPSLPCAYKTHLWPLLSYWNNGRGERQLQILSPFEVFFQSNTIIRQLYTPLFALYRFHQRNPNESHYGILFNLITYDKTLTKTQFTLGPLIDYKTELKDHSFLILKGLIGFQKKEGKRLWRLFWLKL